MMDIRDIEREELEIERLESELRRRKSEVRTKKDEHLNDLLTNTEGDNRFNILKYNIIKEYDIQRQQAKESHKFWSGYNHNSFFNLFSEIQRESLIKLNHVGMDVLLETLEEYLKTNERLLVSGNVVFEVDEDNNIKQFIHDEKKQQEERDKWNRDMFENQLYILSGKSEALKPEEDNKEYKKVSMDTWAYSLGSGEVKRETILEAFKRYLELDRSRVGGYIDKTVLYSLYIKQCEDGPSGIYNKLFFRVKHLYNNK